MKKTISRDLSFLLFQEVYQKYSEPKSRRKAFSILEAAILAFAKKGFSEATLEMIAREAAVTRPLLRYYFKDLAEIKEITLKYIRLLFQKMAVDAISSGKNSQQRVNLYVGSCFQWVEIFPRHADVWFRFLNTCSRDKKSRELNTIAVQTGEERIAQLLEAGKIDGSFSFEDSMVAAKMLQVVITGGLVTYFSENLSDRNTFVAQTQLACSQIIGGTKPVLRS